MTENKVKVFISKKETDWESAGRIKKYLEIVGGDRLNIFVSQDITAGEDWRKCLKKELSSANTLILLFGEPTQEWDWCLYEVGLFTPLRRDVEARTICLHTPNTQLPAQLDNMQHVPANEERMKKFIVDFFGTSIITGIDPPLNIRFTNDRDAVAGLAKKLCSEINSRGIKKSLFYNAIISLNFHPDDIKDGVIPKDALVDVPKLTLEIFGFWDIPADIEHWTWGRLVKEISELQDTKWIKELSKAVKLSCEGKALQPVNTTIKSIASGKIYRPNIHKRDIEPDGTVTVHILLIQEPRKKKGLEQLVSREKEEALSD